MSSSTSKLPFHPKTKKFVVVCFDFGTSGTGYSYSFTNDKDVNMYFETKWEDSPQVYPKTLTQILYNPSNKPIAWGYTASRKYFELDPTVAKNYSLLSNFKLGLFENKSGEIIDSTNGKKFKVVTVIADFLKYIWGILKAKLTTISTRPIPESDVKFAITVPAIWDDRAKAIMKEAAKLAGILPQTREATDDECIIILEPEAASAYCMKQMSESGNALKNKDVIMIVDAGGGTVDITVHMLLDKKLKEVAIREGNTCGSFQINENFWSTLKNHFNDLDRFKTENPAGFHQLMYEWEKAKCSLSTLQDPRSIPALEFNSFAETALKSGSTIYNKAGKKLKLEPSDLETIFKSTITKILDMIRAQLHESSEPVDYIVLVGGFGRSPILFNAVSEHFKTDVKNIIEAPYAPEAVLLGGCLLGLDPSLIKSRKAKLSYGIEILSEYEEGISSESRVKFEGGRFVETGIYFPFVNVGQEVEIDEIRSYQFEYASPAQRSMEIIIYCSAKKNIKYVDEKPFINKLETLELALPPPDPSILKPYINVIMQFGNIEIKIEAEDMKGKKIDIKVRFESGY